MIYLGINVSHNASAALMIDGEIVVAVQEERFTRKKNFTGYPKKSIDYCINFVKKKNKKIDIASFSTIFNPPISYKVPINHFFTINDYDEFYGEKYYSRKLRNLPTKKYIKQLINDKRNNLNLYLPYKKIRYEDLFSGNNKLKILLKNFLYNQSRNMIKKIIFLDHHTCHAYYAYYAALKKNKNCAVITLDGFGDGCNQTVWIPEKKSEKLIKVASTSECEVARIYKFVTLILAMKPEEHEYKVMGLAPYGRKEYGEQIYDKVFKNILQVKNCKIIHKNRPKDLYLYLKKSLSPYRFDNIAAALQLFVEVLSKKIVYQVYKKFNVQHFSISGGVALNIEMIKVISELKFVKQLYVPPSGGDESLALGACYFLSNSNSKYLKNIYLGQAILKELTYKKLKKIFNLKKFRISKNFTHRSLAKLLKKGEIIALTRGKEEFGARALGNRSIIADPSKPHLVKKINEYIKRRDFWMPFALTIIYEKHKKFIYNPKNLRSEFMTISFDTHKKNLDLIRAGTHPYDATVRPQILEKSYNKKYYSIIENFYKISGIPALLNTSFNLHGSPICSNFNDVVKTFKNSGLIYLYINDRYLIKKI